MVEARDAVVLIVRLVAQGVLPMVVVEGVVAIPHLLEGPGMGRGGQVALVAHIQAVVGAAAAQMAGRGMA